MWRILRARRLSDTARATLGVAVTASQPEIKQAYRALAKEWHPDLHPGASKARAEEKFKAIKQAYEALAAAGVGGAAAGGAAQRVLGLLLVVERRPVHAKHARGRADREDVGRRDRVLDRVAAGGAAAGGARARA